MKELKTDPPNPIIETHYPIQRGRKRWIAAKTQSQFKQKVMQNSCVEAAYHRVITMVKAFISGQSVIYYNRDLKQDMSQGPYAMHSFITPNFYWRLECDLCCDYWIQYGFYNCPFEEDIRKLMKGYPLDRTIRSKQFPIDLPSFFNGVRKLQDPKFFFIS